ncbi:MAG: bifunctional serine/threonine-protein kinase/formylglycine-generating enzyme family protein [Chitinophagales bacterium]
MNQQEFFKRYSYNIRTDRIGGGSFGDVYKAHDNVHHEDVAVKVAKVQHFGNKEFSLKIELDTVKSMPDHPNIALYKEVYQFEMPNGIFDYAIMKYYPHGNLKNILSEHSLSQAQKESIARQLIAGVAHLHQNGVLHRDLKPANILIHQQGNNYFPLIADFGLSKLAQSEGSRISNSFGGGTLEYSAPEQLLGKNLRYNADLWALGVIVYEIFTGKRPFVTSDTNSSAEAKRQEIFNKIVNAPLPKEVENLPAPYNIFVANCLEKDPEKRAKTTAEALEKIAINQPKQPFVKDKPTPTPLPPPKKPPLPKPEKTIVKPPPDPPRPQSSWWPLVLGLLVIAGAYYFWTANSSQTADTFSSSSDEAKIVLFKDERSGLYGYKKGEEILIPARYTTAENFENGKGKVSVADSIYYIDTTGTMLELVSVEKQKNQAKDTDGDGIADSEDRCPDEYGLASNNGCPKKEPPKPSQNAIIAQLEKNMVYVAGGSFTMGCTSEQGSDCYDNEKPAHTVSVQSFYIGKYEVTQEEWRAVMGSDPPELFFEGCDRCPVEGVSWNDVQGFLKKLNAQTGKNYRLPSEAEWEYAARGGNKSKGYKYAGSDNINVVARYGGNSNNKTQTVGGKQANELGIYDMSGNVYEWCNDWYKGYPGSSDVTDGTGSYRVNRGGSGHSRADLCRVSDRRRNSPDYRPYNVGFRLAVY